MKKILIIIVFVFILGTVLSSCKSSKCPAYSKNNTEQNDNTNA